jgi:membrane protease YdiL (CAAX protease family)
MLAVNEGTLQVIDCSVLVAGVLALLGCVVGLARSGRWRDPLAGIEIRSDGPGLPGLVAVVFAWVLLHSTANWLLLGSTPAKEVSEPGADAWHRMQAASHAADVVLCGLMLGLLVTSRTLRLRGRPAGVSGGLGLAVGGVLMLLPVMTAQYEMGEAIWRWLRPEDAPPTHVVLQALHRSAWGTWGQIQLVVGAVVVAPLVEELFFRGVVLQTCYQHLRLAWGSIALAGALFGAVHCPQPQDVLPLATMGMALGYVRFRSGSIWPCVLLHMLFNARTMTMVILAPELLEDGV